MSLIKTTPNQKKNKKNPKLPKNHFSPPKNDESVVLAFSVIIGVRIREECLLSHPKIGNW